MFRNNILLLFLLALTFLIGCTSAGGSNLKKTEVKSVWYLVSITMRQKRKPYLGYDISDQFYIKSLAHRFPTLKGSTTFNSPDELLPRLRESGYKASLVMKKGVIHSKPNISGLNGFILIKDNSKLRLSRGVETSMRCLKYEIPNNKPIQYDEDCFVSDSTLRVLGLKVVP